MFFFDKIFGHAKRSFSNENAHYKLTEDESSLIFDNRNVSSRASSPLENDFEIRDCLIFDRTSIISKKSTRKVRRVKSTESSGNSVFQLLPSPQSTCKTRIPSDESLIFQNLRCNIDSSTSCTRMASKSLSSTSTCIGFESSEKCQCDVCKYIAFENLKSKCFFESIQLAQKYCSCFCKYCEKIKMMKVSDAKIHAYLKDFDYLNETRSDLNAKEKLKNKVELMEEMLTLKLQIDAMGLLLKNLCKSTQITQVASKCHSERDSVRGSPQREDFNVSESVHIIVNKDQRSEIKFNQMKYNSAKKEPTSPTTLYFSDIELNQNLVEKCSIIRQLKRELKSLEEINSEDDIIFKSILQHRIENSGDTCNIHGLKWVKINYYVSHFKSFDERDRQVLLIIWENIKAKLK